MGLLVTINFRDFYDYLMCTFLSVAESKNRMMKQSESASNNQIKYFVSVTMERSTVFSFDNDGLKFKSHNCCVVAALEKKLLS